MYFTSLYILQQAGFVQQFHRVPSGSIGGKGMRMGATAAWVRKSSAALMALFLLLSLGIACSKSSPRQASGDASPAPEEQRVSAAEVATGLRQIDDTAKGIAEKAGTDKAAAQQLDARIEPAWQKIEGTIKSNDQDAYITFEDSFAMLGNAAGDGDAAKARTASETVSKAVGDYLTKYPG
jgi:hypothetical protein